MRKILPGLCILYLVFCILYFAPEIFAFSSSSDHFILEGEFGMFGGAKSSSHYALTDTGGGLAVGPSSSENYDAGSGFQYVLAEVREITFTISTNSLDLGTLSTSPTSSSHTISVTTNAADGYQVTVIEDGNLRTVGGADINDVSGGTVDSDTEEYGLATSKSGQDITQDTDCGNPPYNASAITGTGQSVASASNPTTSDQTTLCYAAAITGTTPAGSYSHVLTYIATGTF